MLIHSNFELIEVKQFQIFTPIVDSYFEVILSLALGSLLILGC